MFRLIDLRVLRDAYHELVCVFKILCIRDAGPRGTAVTKSLHWPWQDGPRNELNTYQELYLKDNAHLRHFKTPLTICCTSTTVLKLARKMEDDWMPKDILYGEPQVSWQSVGCSLFQRGIPAKTKEATVQARTKQTIQRQNWCNGRISSDEGMRQRLRVRKEKIFLSLFTATVLCGALLKKKNKQNINCRVWRSLIVAHSKELFMMNVSRE